MPYPTGNKSHDDARNNAEIQRQNSAPTGSSQATYHAADLAFARAVSLSCRTNNNYSGVAQSNTQLKELGVQT
jgi:hypothetical protein